MQTMQLNEPDGDALRPGWKGRSPIRAGACILAGLNRRLFALRFPTFCLLVFAVSVLQNGIWVVPGIKTLSYLSSDVTRQLTQDIPQADYLYSSFLGLLVGYLTGASRSLATFALLHLAFLLLGLVGLTWRVSRKYGDLTARLFVLTLATVPLSNILLTWLGMSDVYVFALSTLLAMTEAAPLLALLAFLLGLSHFEQGIVIASGLSVWQVYRLVRSGRPWRAAVLPVGALIGGVMAAHLLLNWYFAAHGFRLSLTRLGFISGAYWQQALRNIFRHFGTMIFSFHGCYWLVVLAAIHTLWHKNRPLAAGLIGIHAVTMGLGMIALDETRDFSLLIWPFLVLLLRPDVVRIENLRRYVVAAYACGLAVPKLIVWEGRVHSSALFYDALALLSSLAPNHGIFDKPDWLMLPFSQNH